MDKERIEELIKIIETENMKKGVTDYFAIQGEITVETEKTEVAYNRMFENEQWLQDHLDHMSRIYINVAEREVFSCTEKWKRIKIFVKKCIRKMLRWYINPVCEQQSEFNETCFYAIREVRVILDNLLNHYCDGNRVNEHSSEQLQQYVSKLEMLDENIKNLESKELEKDLKITSLIESQQVLVNALEQYHVSMNCRNVVNEEMKNYIDMLLSTVESNRSYIEKLESRIRSLEKRLDEVEK